MSENGLHSEPLEMIPRVKVTFTRSSTRDGGLGYSIQVEEGVTATECDRIFAIAYSLKQKADDALRNKLLNDLEASLAQPSDRDRA